jgi:hypothetical protein
MTFHLSDKVPPLRGLKCPKCEQKLDESIEKTSIRRINYIYRCANCDYLYVRRSNTPSLKMTIKKSIAKHTGDLGELISYRMLSDKGYDLIAFQDRAIDLTNIDNPEYHWLTEWFSAEMLDNFKEFCNAWSRDPITPSGKIRSTSEGRVRSPHFGFDWIGKKEGKYYFIEVKTNKAKLLKYQRKLLLLAKEYGFTPLIVRPKVVITVPLAEVKIKELVS